MVMMLKKVGGSTNHLILLIKLPTEKDFVIQKFLYIVKLRLSNFYDQLLVGRSFYCPFRLHLFLEFLSCLWQDELCFPSSFLTLFRNIGKNHLIPKGKGGKIPQKSEINLPITIDSAFGQIESRAKFE